MYKKRYEVALEIEGKFAHFERPDTGAGLGTYCAPTFSSAKGIFESIKMIKGAVIVPYRIEICCPIKTCSIKFNYRGPLRKHNLIKDNLSSQINMTVLQDVCYKIFAFCISYDENGVPELYKNINGGHSYQEQLLRKIKKSQCFSTPTLGNSEFLPSYWGEIRSETKADESINMVIPSMLLTPFSKLKNGEYDAKNVRYAKNIEIKNGVLNYPIEEIIND